MEEHNTAQREALEHAWRYFALHANQRMSMFNYFLILFALVATGVAASIDKGGVYCLVGVVLSALLIVVSVCFWKLDQRTSFLIKRAEHGLADVEARMFESASVRLFADEPSDSQSAAAIKKLWTYGRAFRLVFLLAGLVGGLALLWSLQRWGGAAAPPPERAKDAPTQG